MNTFYSKVGKRLFDVFIALVGLAVLWPLFVIFALAIKLDSRGPAFFRQVRTGRYGRRFKVLKFRTMIHHSEGAGLKVTAAGDPRITRIGRWLRRAKIDELPQLMNVLRGEMTVVGPRPEMPQYTALYRGDQQEILSVKPGITGPASLRFKDEERLLAFRDDCEHFYISHILPAKVEMDLSYCPNPTFIGDVRLILQTARRIFSSGRPGCAAVCSGAMSVRSELER